MTLDFETDQFLTLLTDALRAGPGSPAWHEAVTRLKQQGVQDSDEYKMLLETRQHLESGKPYRQVRPGPEFTRKILAAIEEDAGSSKSAGIPTPTLIAIAAGMVGLIILILIGWLLMANGRQHTTLADLENQSFTRDVRSARLTGSIPPGWNSIGPVPLTFDHELRAAAKAGEDYRGGGIVTSLGIPADQPVAMEVTVRYADPTENVITQAFVTDQPDFSQDRGTSPHEFVWTLQPTAIHNNLILRSEVVLPDGTFGDTADDIRKPGTLTVRIAINGDFILVSSGSKQLYADRNHLDPDKPRYFGVRFLRKGDISKNQTPGIEVVRILQ